MIMPLRTLETMAETERQACRRKAARTREAMGVIAASDAAAIT